MPNLVYILAPDVAWSLARTCPGFVMFTILPYGFSTSIIAPEESENGVNTLNSKTSAVCLLLARRCIDSALKQKGNNTMCPASNHDSSCST